MSLACCLQGPAYRGWDSGKRDRSIGRKEGDVVAFKFEHIYEALDDSLQCHV